MSVMIAVDGMLLSSMLVFDGQPKGCIAKCQDRVQDLPDNQQVKRTSAQGCNNEILEIAGNLLMT